MTEGVAYHPDFGAPVRYRLEDIPDDPDAQVPISIARMRQYVQQDYTDPLIQEDAREMVEAGDGDPIAGAWLLVKPRLRFQHDIDTATRLALDDRRLDDVVETFIRPVDQSLLIRRQGGVEDCDGFVMYGAALLAAAGVPLSFCTAAVDPDEPGRFSHVYLVAYVNGRRIPLDLSHGAYPGWECPNLGRVREWPLFGSEPPCPVWPFLAVVALFYSVRYFARKGGQ